MSTFTNDQELRISTDCKRENIQWTGESYLLIVRSFAKPSSLSTQRSESSLCLDLEQMQYFEHQQLLQFYQKVLQECPPLYTKVWLCSHTSPVTTTVNSIIQFIPIPASLGKKKKEKTNRMSPHSIQQNVQGTLPICNIIQSEQNDLSTFYSSQA